MNKVLYSALVAIMPLGVMAQDNTTHNIDNNSSTSHVGSSSVANNDSSNVINEAPQDSIHSEHRLQGVTVKSTATRRMAGALNGMVMGRQELFKAACCNLGESFVNNPSVDVNYSDAATGAEQIKLLGLAGTYVQMLTENLPNFRGAAAPYSLGYVPGPWMNSIQVSKGCASVKNGYESLTGQINVNYLQPEAEQKTEINLFGDTETSIEANVTTNLHLGKKWSTGIMAHYEDQFSKHDDNGDGFIDMPFVRQGHLDNRWVYMGDKYIFHGGISALLEKREGGQTSHSHTGADDATNSHHLFKIGIDTKRYETYMKHAFILDHEKGTNIALMSSAAMHELDARFGNKSYSVNEKNLYASLMFETKFTPMHELSAGVSLNHDYLGQHSNVLVADGTNLAQCEKETVPGAYAQYTFNWNSKITAMAGFRVDHSSAFGTFYTPRFNVKFTPSQIFTLRLSAGKGYRMAHPLAEDNFLLASGRTLFIEKLAQEEAWNYGATTAWNIPLGSRLLKLNVEYFYTRFHNQAVVDYDSDPFAITIGNLHGKSYSHTFQADATYEPIKGLSVTAAYRLNDVKTTYAGRLMEKPLTSKYKALFALSYKTPLELWQFDVNLQLNGGGRMPEPYAKADGTMSWNRRFHSYEQLSMQITRWFRHFSVYVGAENLTDFTQKSPIIGASNPWNKEFEPTLVWGPVDGRMFYAGVRVTL